LMEEQEESFSKVLKQNQREFETTIGRMERLSRLSQESVDQVTGGDSFPNALAIINPEIAPNLAGPGPGLPILIENHGEYPLYDVSVSIQESGAGQTVNASISQQSLGDMRPYDSKWLNTKARVPDGTDEVHYYIQFRARNGGWTEFLWLRRRGSAIQEFDEVQSNQFPGKPSKILLKLDFPKP